MRALLLHRLRRLLLPLPRRRVSPYIFDLVFSDPGELMDLSVPDTVDNRYKVLEVIGTGAMATVYAAEDTSPRPQGCA